MWFLGQLLNLFTRFKISTKPITSPGAVSNIPVGQATSPGVVTTVASTEPASPGAVAHASPQETALSRIEDVWEQQATTKKCDSPTIASARELACQFRACLQSER